MSKPPHSKPPYEPKPQLLGAAEMMADLPPPLSEPLRVAELATRKANRFKFIPDAAARAQVAEWAQIEALKALEFTGELVTRGRSDWVLTGKLSARVVQACSLTGAPVAARIEEEVLRRYLADWVAPTGEEAEMPEDDSEEPLGAVIDIAHVALEALELALPLYPRAEGAEFGAMEAAPEGAAPLESARPSPFAGLAGLLGDAQKDKDNP